MATIKGKSRQSRTASREPMGKAGRLHKVAKSSPNMEAKKGHNRTRTQLGQG